MKFFHERGLKVRGSCEGCWRRTESLGGQGAAWLLEHTITLIPCTRFRHHCRPISGEFFDLGEFSPLLGRDWQHLKQANTSLYPFTPDRSLCICSTDVFGNAGCGTGLVTAVHRAELRMSQKQLWEPCTALSRL